MFDTESEYVNSLSERIYSFIDLDLKPGTEEENYNLALIFGASTSFDLAFEDYIPYKQENLYLELIARTLPEVLHFLLPNYHKREIKPLPEEFHVKTQPLTDIAIRELAVYTGTETETEFYGYKIYQDEKGEWVVDVFIEKGMYDLTYLIHSGKEYISPVELIESEEKVFAQNEEEISLIRDQMVKSVLWLKKNKLVHRDLKPANWIVTETGLKLIDFGTTVAEGILVSRGMTTIPYQPPEDRYSELTANRDYSIIKHSYDLWSLGASILELETRTVPFAQFDYRYIINSYSLKGYISRLLYNLLSINPKFRRLD